MSFAISTTPTLTSRAEPGSVRNNLRANLGDGAGFSVMVGIGEAYLPAFALAVGVGELLAGLVASLPMLAGAILQLASPYAVGRLQSHRRWVILCASCQALSFLPLAAAALAGHLATPWVFLIASMYWGAGLATGPAWNTWMEAIIPKSVRHRFFASRTRMTQAGMVTGLLAGGTALQIGKLYHCTLPAFAVLFGIAFLSRCFSVICLIRQTEPVPSAERLRGVQYRQVLSRFRIGGGNGLLVYLLCVQMSVWLSGPYFTPYMLKKLNISYGGFALLTAAALAAKVISLPYFGKYAQRFGTRRLLWIGGLGIVPVSGLWLVSDSFAYLLLLQIIGGVAWAAYELAMFLVFFETIDAKERTSVLTIFNVGNALATVAGSLLGWGLLTLLGQTQQAYLALFLASSVARLLTLIQLARVSGVFHRFVVPLFTRGLSVGPAIGAIDRPILASIAELPTQAVAIAPPCIARHAADLAPAAVAVRSADVAPRAEQATAISG